MTEQEALYILENSENISDVQVALKVAIKALEEIQQYRALGTVEDCRAAMEKQTPKNPIKTNIYEGERAEILKKRGAINPEVFKCPACKKIIDPGYSNSYCKKCGQRIVWENKKEPRNFTAEEGNK